MLRKVVRPPAARRPHDRESREAANTEAWSVRLSQAGFLCGTTTKELHQTAGVSEGAWSSGTFATQQSLIPLILDHKACSGVRLIPEQMVAESL